MMNSINESIRKIIREELKNIFEDINIPINIGDEIFCGKFLNKKIIVKTIEKDGKGGKGGYNINGKPLLRFRIPNK